VVPGASEVILESGLAAPTGSSFRACSSVLAAWQAIPQPPQLPTSSKVSTQIWTALRVGRTDSRGALPLPGKAAAAHADVCAAAAVEGVVVQIDARPAATRLGGIRTNAVAFTQFWSAAQAGLQPAAPPVVATDVPPGGPPVLSPA